jgi:hypothetical protein
MGGFAGTAADWAGEMLQSGVRSLARESGPLGKEMGERLMKYDGGWREIAGPAVNKIKNTAGLTTADKLLASEAEVNTAKAIAGAQHLGVGTSELKRLVQGIHDTQGYERARQAWITSMHSIKRPYSVNLSGSPPLLAGVVPGLKRSQGEELLNFWNTNTKLSLAPLAHTLQPFNITMVTKMGPAVKGFIKAIGDRKTAAATSIESGAALEDLMRNWTAQVHGSIAEKMTRQIMRPLNFITNFNKQWAVSSGPYMLKNLSEDLIQNQQNPRVLRMLDNLEIKPLELLRRGPQDKTLLMKTMRKISDLAFPETNVMTVPPLWRQSGIARVGTMFKPFLFKQAKFLNDFVFREAFKYHNYKPLMSMMMIYPGLGAIGSLVRAMAREGTTDPQIPSFDKEHWADRLVWGMSQVGGLAIYNDILGAFGAPRGTTRIGSFFFGPVAADIIGAASTISDFARSNNPYLTLDKEIEESIVPRVPFVGPAVSHGIRQQKPVRDWPRKQLLQGYVTSKINPMLGIKPSSPTSEEVQ